MATRRNVVRLSGIAALLIVLGISGAVVLLHRDAEERLEQRGAELVRFPNGDVAIVQLFGNTLGDEDLAHLKGMQRIRRLYFRGPTNISDAGMVHLAGLTSLKRLKLTGTGVGNDGVEHLKQLSHLQILVLDKTNVDDAGLVHLAGMNELYALNLEGTQVSDRGLQHLQGLDNLRILNVSQTQVTAEGVDHCRELLPQCHIIHPSTARPPRRSLSQTEKDQHTDALPSDR